VKADELISILSNDRLPHQRSWPNLALGAVVGTLVAATFFSAAIRFRPDIAQAVQTVRFLFKFVATISLAATAVLMSFKLSRPDVEFGSSGALLARENVVRFSQNRLHLAPIPSHSRSIELK
jgi:hypothetical protein